MIRPSLIYAAVTILLAFIDSVRIKRAKGIVENINHDLSVLLAALAATLVFGFCHLELIGAGWQGLKEAIPVFAGFLFVRLAIYDISLNLWRRYKIDYESPTTSSYEDQHTNKLTFWDKRILAVAGWGACVFIHWIIYKN